jgi:tetratricopeptide repeat protein 30
MAIEYDQRHFREARNALKELPVRSEEDLDPITLHNTALVTMDDDPSGAFRKLNFLQTQDPPLTETFRNLLLGYCKYEYYSHAADLLAEDTELAVKTMGRPMLDFLEAVLVYPSSKDEAYRKFDELCKVKGDILRRVLKQMEEAKRTQDVEQQQQLSLEFDANVGELIPVLMFQAKIFWDLGKYELIELLLMKYMDFCLDNRTWKLNLAHTYFMQKTKTLDAIQWYEPLVLGEQNLLDIEAILVANLCVSYVITDQNGLADTLINRLTEEEAQKAKEDPNAKLYHLSIIHLVIGTLYCAHKNFDFGLDYIFNAFTPMHAKLNPDARFYAKKWLLEVIRAMA